MAAPDTIVEFIQGEDVIDFSSIDANSSRRGDQAFADGGENSSVVANSVTWFENGGDTIIQADMNGDASTDLQIILAGVNLQRRTSSLIVPSPRRHLRPAPAHGRAPGSCHWIA